MLRIDMERREALGFKLDTYGYNIQDILAEYEFLEPYEQLYNYLQVV
jgi:hypothetical protein